MRKPVFRGAPGPLLVLIFDVRCSDWVATRRAGREILTCNRPSARGDPPAKNAPTLDPVHRLRLNLEASTTSITFTYNVEKHPIEGNSLLTKAFDGVGAVLLLVIYALGLWGPGSFRTHT